jgi:hypothetical protein
MADEPEIIPPSQYVDRIVRALSSSDPHAYVDQSIRALRDVYNAERAARDEAVRILHDDMVRVPTLLDRAELNITTQLRSETESLADLTEQKFANVWLRFTELEKRSRDLDEARAIALTAALNAAKEAVGEQNRSNTTAIEKSEKATNDKINQLEGTFNAANKATNERLDDVKSRLDRGEGGVSSALVIGSGLMALLAILIAGYAAVHVGVVPQPTVQYVPAPTAVPAPVTVPR